VGGESIGLLMEGAGYIRKTEKYRVIKIINYYYMKL
jgi:hypothetical protein